MARAVVQGMIAREREDYPRAEECLGRSLDIATERDDLRLVAEINREQADLFRRMGRNRDALQALNQAHKLFAKLQARQEWTATRTGPAAAAPQTQRSAALVQ